MENQDPINQPAVDSDPSPQVDPQDSPQPEATEESSQQVEEVKEGFWDKKFNRYLVYAVIVAFFALGGLAVALYLYDSSQEEEQLFSDEDTLEILSQVIDNNPKGIINGYDTHDAGNAGGSLGVSGYYGMTSSDEKIVVPVDSDNPTTNSPIPSPVIPDVGESRPAEEEIAIPDLDVYNYRHTVSVFEPGPAYEDCYGTDWASEERRDEYREYFDLDRTYYKMVSTVDDGDFAYYHLGKYGIDVNEYYNYRGGDFGVLILNEVNPSFSNEWRMDPVSYPGEGLSVSERVRMYFGSDADITDVYEEAGVTYYEITTVYQWGCGTSGRILIWIYTVNAETFEVVLRRGFVDNLESLSNLISEMDVTITRDKVSLTEVEGEFEFDYDVEAKEIDFAGYVYDENVEYERFMNYFESNDYNLVVPSLDNFDLTYLSGKNLPERVPDERYYLERPYYADNDKGQDEYERMISSRMDRSYVSTGYSDDEYVFGWINVNLYGRNSYVDNLLDDMFKYYDPDDVEKSLVSITINDRNKVVEKAYSSYEAWYRYPISYPTSYPTSYPVIVPTSYGNYYTYLMYKTYLGFRYNDFPYLVDNYGSNHWYPEGVEYSYLRPRDIDQGDMADAIESYLTGCGHWW